MSNKIWVYVDQFKGHAHSGSWEAIGAGRTLAAELGGEVTALVFGAQAETVAKEAIQYGASEVFYCDDATLADYRPEPYVALFTQLAQEHNPEVVLFPTTTRGREVAAMGAIDLHTGVMPDVTALEVVEGRVVATRPVYAGKLLAKTVCASQPQLITTRTRAFPKPEMDPSRSGSVTKVEPVLSADQIATQVAGYTESEGGVSLTDASVIVSGGRGVSNNPRLDPPADLDEKQAEIWRAQQGFKLVGELATVLGAAMGASRALTCISPAVSRAPSSTRQVCAPAR